MEKNKGKEKIDIRKYVNFILTMIAVVLVALIAVKLYNTYQDNKIGTSVFTRMAGNIQIDDIENSTIEMSTDSFILISYVKNEEVRKFEEDLKKTVVDNELQNNFYYLDATNLMLEEGYTKTLNKKFKLENPNEIEELPAILYYKDGKLIRTISSTKNQMLSSDDFEKLLDSYEIIETK